MGFGPGGMSILSFADLENLPKPPPDAALNGQGNDSVKSQTWFYYLAEVASWKLLDRVSKALYQGRYWFFYHNRCQVMTDLQISHYPHRWQTSLASTP